MSKVIQIREVPDEVHDALVRSAAAQGLSLTRYVQRELEHLANRAQRVEHNAAIVRRTQSSMPNSLDRATILSVLREGRDG